MSNFLLFLGTLTAIVMFNVMFLYRDKPMAIKEMVTTTLQPLDFTVTYCEACKKCTSHATLDLIDFEECNDFDK